MGVDDLAPGKLGLKLLCALGRRFNILPNVIQLVQARLTSSASVILPVMEEEQEEQEEHLMASFGGTSKGESWLLSIKKGHVDAKL